MDYHAVLKQVESWLMEVGTEQLEGLGRKLSITTKSSEFDPVTDVDRKSEEFLVGAIQHHYPEHSILTEERGAMENGSGYRWVIDPLDGTVNYAHRFPIFGISVALQHHGQTMLGAVYFPVLKEFFHAILGEGALLNDRRIAVSPITELSKSLLATGFPYDRATDPDNNLNYFNHLMLQIGGISRSGSAAFDLCNVACGRINGYWEFKVHLWDVAAGDLIVSEAGGKVDYLECRKGVALIAGNGKINESIYRELTKVNPAVKRIEE